MRRKLIIVILCVLIFVSCAKKNKEPEIEKEAIKIEKEVQEVKKYNTPLNKEEKQQLINRLYRISANLKSQDKYNDLKIEVDEALNTLKITPQNDFKLAIDKLLLNPENENLKKAFNSYTQVLDKIAEVLKNSNCRKFIIVLKNPNREESLYTVTDEGVIHNKFK